jgi:hypothetical protein
MLRILDPPIRYGNHSRLILLMGGWQASPSESCREGELVVPRHNLWCWTLVLALPGKLAELAYRPSRELLFFSMVTELRGRVHRIVAFALSLP